MANTQNEANIAQDERYNGWTNYETWLVALWIDNDESTQTYWHEEADREIDQAACDQMVEDGTWTLKQAARFRLAERLQEQITDTAPDMTASVFSDLLQVALNRVNWLEVAHDIFQDLLDC